MENNEILKKEYDLVVIGSGTAGADAAVRAAQFGLSVLVIEKDEKLGGTCVNVGCVPTKKLIHFADTYQRINESLIEGFAIEREKFNYNKFKEIKDNLINQIISWYKYNVFPSYEIGIMKGEAKILSKNKIEVNGSTIISKNILIATGSKPKIPNISGIDEAMKEKYVITSDDFFDLTSLPENIIILGGGPIGVELGSILRKFDLNVTIVEMMDRLIPGLDSDLGNFLMKIFDENGIKIITNAYATKIDFKSRTLNLSNGIILHPDLILIATGRIPVITNLNLDNLGIKTNKGAIVVDEYMRTSIPNIYAAGDVTGISMMANVAKLQAIVAAENIAGLKTKINYSLIPVAVFSDPEIGSVGISAFKNDPNYIVKKMPNAINYRAIAYNKPYGFTKVVIDKKTNEIVGFHMVGFMASEIINTALLAIKKHFTIENSKEITFSHPAMSELFIDAIELAGNFNLYLPKKI
ncbi:MAG: dihydrolipoyl dehydrogenase family protein [Thermoplasmata archaeon]|jgi:dihydrolipoamide dehydrogenase